MTNQISPQDTGRSLRCWLILSAAVIVVGALCVWCLVAWGDREMREDLLARTHMVAVAMNVESLKTLTGTEADLELPEYLRLKDHLATVRAANPRFKFLRLMGGKPDGTMFSFVDDVPVGHEDEAPAGMIYEDLPEGFRRVSTTGVASVEGPFMDRRGAFVSGCVPLIDPESGDVLAILPVDHDAQDWRRDVVARAGLPMGLVLILIIALAAALFGSVRTPASPKPVLRRLLPGLTLLLVMTIALAGMLLWQEHGERLRERTGGVVAEVQHDLQGFLNEQARGLAAAANTIAMDHRTRQALRTGDRERLLADWLESYRTLNQENGLTHFYFFDADRACLLRVHNPDRRGDTINRFTAMEAEQIGKTASGIELGPLGTFTLRVVQPVFVGPTLLGYVEMGKEIEDVLQTIRGRRTGVELAVVINKEVIRRETWEAGMRMLGREADWDRLPRGVVIYASQGRLPDAFAALADHHPVGGDLQKETVQQIAADGRVWRFSSLPLKDASGMVVGDLLVMNDITALKAAFSRDMTMGGAAGVILLAAVLALVVVMLRRTDEDIRAQQAELRESEERLSATLRSIGDGVIACDGEGRVTSLNHVAETLTGWTSPEAAGRPLEEVFRIVNAWTRETVENPMVEALRDGVNVDLANHTALIARDGTEHQIADSCAPIQEAGAHRRRRGEWA